MSIETYDKAIKYLEKRYNEALKENGYKKLEIIVFPTNKKGC